MSVRRYLVIGRADHSGGSMSHQMNMSIFRAQNYETQLFTLSKTVTTLKSYFQRENSKLISLNHDNSFKDFIKMKINYYILKKVVVDLDSTIIDGALPLACEDIAKLKLFASVIRSTPKCFAWTKRPQKLIVFLEQIRASENIICASRSEAEIWKERIDDLHKPVIQYLTPMDLSANSTMLDLGYGEPFLLLPVGNIGPRKGIELFLRLLDERGRRCKVLVLGKGIIPVDEYINLEVEVKHAKINLCNPITNAIRVFPSHSECFSRAQFEGILSGDPCLISRAGSDPEINKFLEPLSVCNNMNDLVDQALNYIQNFENLERRNTENAINFYNTTQAQAFKTIANH